MSPASSRQDCSRLRPLPAFAGEALAVLGMGFCLGPCGLVRFHGASGTGFSRKTPTRAVLANALICGLLAAPVASPLLRQLIGPERETAGQTGPEKTI